MITASLLNIELRFQANWHPVTHTQFVSAIPSTLFMSTSFDTQRAPACSTETEKNTAGRHRRQRIAYFFSVWLKIRLMLHLEPYFAHKITHRVCSCMLCATGLNSRMAKIVSVGKPTKHKGDRKKETGTGDNERKE